jgi:hypothetical protein
MSVMDWVGTVGAIWLAVSILLAVAWWLSGRRVFRKPPVPTKPAGMTIRIVAQDKVQRDIARQANNPYNDGGA